MKFTLQPCLRMLGVALAATAMSSAQAELIDRGGGLIYDTVLNITWLQDSNYAATSGYQVPGRAADDPMINGLMDWAESMAWAQNLNYYDSVRGVTWSDWHLPSVRPVGGGPTMVSAVATDGSSDDSYNISAPGSMYPGSTASHLAYLYFNTLGNVAMCAPNTGFAGCLLPSDPRPVPFNFGPFSNPGGGYWTNSNADVVYAADAWGFRIQGAEYGAQAAMNGTGYWGRGTAWAVMDGDVGLAPIPETGTLSMMVAGLMVGWGVRRRIRRAGSPTCAL